MPTRASTQSRAVLRRRFRRARRMLSRSQQATHARRITQHYLRSPLIRRAQRVAMFIARDGEPDLTQLAIKLTALNKTLALPVVGVGSRMDFYRYDPATVLTPNRYGIGEPPPGSRYLNTRAIDVLLMPLVTFDDAGNRLGMGAGFYDRHLARLPMRLRPWLVGVAHEIQRCPSNLPTTPWDIPLDAVLTEAGWQTWNLRLGS